MIIIKKIYLFSIVLLFIININVVLGALVAVYVEPRGDDPYSQCIEARTGDDAYKVLSELDDAKFNYINNQHILCSIGDGDTNFICDTNSDRSLRVVYQINGVWESDPIVSYDAGSKCYDTNFNLYANFVYYSFTTHTFSNAHYCAKDGDVLGIINEIKPTSRPEAPDFSNRPSFKEICEPLKINDVKVYINEFENNDVDDSGGTIKNVASGSEIKFSIELKNIGLKKLDETIENVKASIIVKKVNVNEDLEENSEYIDIDASDKETVDININLPNYMKEGRYDLTLKVVGETDEGVEISDDTDYTLVVVKGSASSTATNENSFLVQENNAQTVQTTNLNEPVVNSPVVQNIPTAMIVNDNINLVDALSMISIMLIGILIIVVVAISVLKKNK